MPPKIRVVNRSIGSDNVPEFVKQFAYQVSLGNFDTHLDLLYAAIDERLRQYTGKNIPNTEETQKKLAKVRKLRGADVEPEIDHRYGVFGEKYRGMEVLFHGEAESYENGARKARVEVIISAESGMEAGEFRLIPFSALMELPPIPESSDSETDDMTHVQKI